MKKLLIFIPLAILLLNCSFIPPESEHEETFMVIDRSSNKVMSTYDYDYTQKNPLVRTKVYDDAERVSQIREYSYDQEGHVRSIVETVPNKPSRVINFTTLEIRDEEGRITRVIQKNSLGDKVETFYGYDETGRLRGTVIQTNDDAVIMKDYLD